MHEQAVLFDRADAYAVQAISLPPPTSVISPTNSAPAATSESTLAAMSSTFQ